MDGGSHMECTNRLGDVHSHTLHPDMVQLHNHQHNCPTARWVLKMGHATTHQPALLALYVWYGIERPKHCATMT